MELKLQKIWSKILFVLLTLGFCFSHSACTDPETTDSTDFALYYAGVTDIGPSMNFTLDAPTYIGGQPYDFAIIGVKHDGEPYETDCFTITSNGAIEIQNTGALPVGLYTLSISCFSNGDYYSFEDIVSINMMKTVPDGITVEPNEITVDYADIIDTESEVELPTAQVSTDGDHISISKYLIANVRKDGVKVTENDFFKIDAATGEISIVRGASAIQPGKYVLDLKLTTAVVGEDSEEGIFQDALTIDVTSRPLALTYVPEVARVEVNSAFSSVAPVCTGSLDGLTYAIKSVSLPDAPVSIDPATGVISLAADNALEIGENCVVSVTATNKYGSADFENVYTISIVAFIEPITKLAYDDLEVIQNTAFEIEPTEKDGGEVTYSFVNLDSKLSDLQIDPLTGVISAKKGNSIPRGVYTVTVSAKNIKSELTDEFTLTVNENPNYFTYVSWGNNLNLTPAKNYASQFRATSQAEFETFSFDVVDTDLGENATNVEYSIDSESSSAPSAISIDKTTGKFTVRAGKGWKDNKVIMVVVNTTAGKGTPAEVTVKTPIFFDCSVPVKGVTVRYTPFVMQVNPRTGGVSVAPEVTGVADRSKFLMDYRRTFDYYNLNGPAEHLKGQPSVKGSFMNSMWQAYYDAIGKGINTGARAPLSYYDNAGKLSVALGYVDETASQAVKINANKWQNDYGFANGVMIGQMTFVTDGNSNNVGSGTGIFPIAIWFDTRF